MKKIFGKLLIIIIPILAAVVLLYPTYRSGQLETIHNQYISDAFKAKNRADSAAIMERFEKSYGEEFTSIKTRRLKLGLDLRGGMYVTLEVDIVKLLEETAQRDAVDETFLEVINKTRVQSQSSDNPVIDIFIKNFNEIARPKGKSLISYFDIGDVKDATEEKILDKLKQNAQQAIDQAQEVIRQRIDKYGVSEPNIQKVGTRRIILELPGVTNEVEMRQLLQTTARLEFKLVRNNVDIVKAFAKIDKLLYDQAKRRKSGQPAMTPDSTAVKDLALTKESKTATASKESSSVSAGSKTQTSKADTANPYAGLSEDETKKRFAEDHPFTKLFATFFVPKQPGAKLQPFYYIGEKFPDAEAGDYLFRIGKDSINKFNEILSRPEIRPLIPLDLQVCISAKPDERLEKEKVLVYDFYSLKKDPELTGDVITDARATFDPQSNQPMVLMNMNSDGSERWSVITGANLKKRIAIVLDERVYSAPTVQNKITGGGSQITGMANTEEAHLLEIVLKAGALKAPVQIIEERIVGPSLGDDSIRSGLTASAIAFLLVVLYMAIYYSAGGLVADFAVLLNVGLILATLSAFNGTLSLPGIAGIILTIGMAVDANVLIFERIREELVKGRSLRSAIDEGFSKALSAIIDSNVTTFITGLILYYFGTGPIQGFAMTLMIGIIGTLFTAIVVSKAIIEIFIIRGASHFSFGQPKLIKNI